MKYFLYIKHISTNKQQTSNKQAHKAKHISNAKHKAKAKKRMMTAGTNVVAGTSILLPPGVIGYIASFIRTNFESELLLNLYKAFNSINGEGYEDPLADYNAEVQSRIAYLAVDGVILDDITYALTEREVMYLFDCFYCDPSVIMYGEETYEDIGDICIVNTEQRRKIDHEFLDCSEYTESLALPYMGIKFGLSDELNIKMYKYIRLLEEALRLKSHALIAYMKDKLVLSPDMLIYVYIKHNHKLYAPDWFSLAADDRLLALIKDAGVLPTVLGLAIGGKHGYYAGSEAALNNIVNHNLAVVKKIVPAHISTSSDVIQYPVYYDDYEGRQRFFDLLTPYAYWETTYHGEITLYTMGEDTKNIKVVGSEEIGAYLRGLCPLQPPLEEGDEEKGEEEKGDEEEGDEEAYEEEWIKGGDPMNLYEGPVWGSEALEEPL